GASNARTVEWIQGSKKWRDETAEGIKLKHTGNSANVVVDLIFGKHIYLKGCLTRSSIPEKSLLFPAQPCLGLEAGHRKRASLAFTAPVF
ncbi:hypothetical protein ACQP3C_28275, partial [Escherichia coli]